MADVREHGKKPENTPENIHRVSKGDFDLEPTLFRKGDEMDVLAFNIQEMSGRIKALMDQVVRDKEIQQENQYQLAGIPLS